MNIKVRQFYVYVFKIIHFNQDNSAGPGSGHVYQLHVFANRPFQTEAPIPIPTLLSFGMEHYTIFDGCEASIASGGSWVGYVAGYLYSISASDNLVPLVLNDRHRWHLKARLHGVIKRQWRWLTQGEGPRQQPVSVPVCLLSSTEEGYGETVYEN
jgi:hypothetical protein